MPRDRAAYLWDIADACRALLEFLQDRDFTEYQQNRMLRRAVERELLVVGEAISQIARHFPDLASQFGEIWQIIGFRNRLVHEYAEIDQSIAWVIVQDRVPELLERAERLLEQET